MPIGNKEYTIARLFPTMCTKSFIFLLLLHVTSLISSMDIEFMTALVIVATKDKNSPSYDTDVLYQLATCAMKLLIHKTLNLHVKIEAFSAT